MEAESEGLQKKRIPRESPRKNKRNTALMKLKVSRRKSEKT
jgi:hypothetical protein